MIWNEEALKVSFKVSSLRTILILQTSQDDILLIYQFYKLILFTNLYYLIQNPSYGYERNMVYFNIKPIHTFKCWWRKGRHMITPNPHSALYTVEKWSLHILGSTPVSRSLRGPPNRRRATICRPMGKVLRRHYRRKGRSHKRSFQQLVVHLKKVKLRCT